MKRKHSLPVVLMIFIVFLALHPIRKGAYVSGQQDNIEMKVDDLGSQTEDSLRDLDQKVDDLETQVRYLEIRGNP